MHNSQRQDVVAPTAKLPRRAVNTEHPRLRNLHPIDDHVSDFCVIQLKVAKEPLQTFVMGLAQCPTPKA